MSKSILSLLKKHNQEIDDKFHQLTQFNILDCASFFSFFQMIENIEGDIVECGIGRSRSLAITCALTGWLCPQRQIHAYDSFAGFPQPHEKDKSSRNPQKGDWSRSPSGKYEYTEQFCRMILESAEIDTNAIKLQLHKGFFNATLPSNPSQKIALLNIDGDLYESYRDCLENLFPKVSVGGVILFDDFSFDATKEAAFPGSRLAVREYLGDAEYGKIRQNQFGRFFYLKTKV